MIHRILRIFVFTCMTALGAAAQDPWEYRTAAGEYAFATGDFERAETEFRAALELSQRLPPGSRRLEISLDNLARLYEHQMRLDEAQPLFQLLLAAQETRVGHEDPLLLDTLVAVARVALSSGDSPTATTSLRRYLGIAEASGSADPGQHWHVLSMLARMRTIEEDPDEALELQRRAVRVLSEDPAASAQERANQLESLAQMELLHGSNADAERLLDEAVELRRAAGEMGSAETLATAAATALSAGHTELADRLAQRALVVAAEEGTDSLAVRKVAADVAWMTVRRGGSVADLLGVANDAENLVVAAQRTAALVELQMADPTADEAALSESYSRMARIEALRGDADEAARWQLRYVDSLTTSSAGGGNKLLVAQSDVVALLAAAGRIEEAVANNATLIRNIEDIYGPNDPKLSLPLQRQYDLLSELGSKKEAKAVKKRLRKFRKSQR
jgi:tetratricopeptide (TPR) repeat protein